MSQELEPVLPDAVFVEAALGRFTAAGEASVAGAGFCRVIFRHAAHERVQLCRVGGHLLGCFWGNDHDEVSWSLVPDDELTMASDGLYDQPDMDGRELEHHILEYLAQRLASGRTMHNALVEVVQKVLGTQPGRDDISVLSVLRGSEVRP
jgi:serine phosphatase RsbU (regulator of sigma subunit)